MTADEAYRSKECEALFDVAHEMFPDYDEGADIDSWPMDEAADYIFDRLQEQLPGKHWDDDKFTTDLYEMIIAGLT